MQMKDIPLKKFCYLFIVSILSLYSISCSSDKSEKGGEKKLTQEELKSINKPAFQGIVPVQDSVLLKPRKTNEGGFSYYPEDTLFRFFVEDLKKYVENDAIDRVSECIFFPVACSLSGKPKDIHEERDFKRHYPEIFNAKIKKSIQSINNAEKNFRNQYGYQIGNGELWCAKFRNNKNEIFYRITTINN